MSPDAILDVCTYHRRDFDLVVVRSRPHETQTVLPSLQTAFEGLSTSGLGILDSLPVELLCIILHNLDLLSYFRFRHINRRARVLATKICKYQSVVQYGLEGLRGVLRAGLSKTWTIRHLYASLVCEKCELCGEFGGFLFLPTAIRCCFACVRSAPELQVMPTSTFSQVAQVSTKRLRRALGSELLHTVPGLYSMEEKRVKRPKSLVAVQGAIAKLQLLGILKEDASRALLAHKVQVNHRFMASTTLPWYDPNIDKVESGVSCKGCQVRVENSLVDSHQRDCVFSRSGYLIHFASCPEAQELWEKSKGGTVLVKEPEFTRRCGYISVLDDDGLPR